MERKKAALYGGVVLGGVLVFGGCAEGISTWINGRTIKDIYFNSSRGGISVAFEKCIRTGLRENSLDSFFSRDLLDPKNGEIKPYHTIGHEVLDRDCK
jgi:hypothetical protein